MLCLLNSPIKKRSIGEFICKNGHMFDRQMSSLSRNDECPICKRGDLIRDKEKQFASNALKIGFKYHGGYINKTSRVELECTKCKDTFFMQADSFVKLKRCPHCKHTGELKNKKEIKTIREIADENNIEIIQFAPGRSGLTTFKCKKCGDVFKKANRVFRSGRKCVSCARIDRESKRDKMYRKRLRDNMFKLVSKHKIKKNTDQITIKCVNGHVFETSMIKLGSKMECPKCS